MNLTDVAVMLTVHSKRATKSDFVCMPLRWISVWDRRDLSVTDVSLSVSYNMCKLSFCPC